MIDEIELRDGWYWPKADIQGWRFISDEVRDIDEIMNYVKGRDVVIQAGGNCGMWPKKYATIFKTVYTFEPDPTNYECLRRNVTEPNVIIQNCALSENQQKVGIEVRWDDNRGANRVTLDGDIPCVTIDSLNAPACDLLQLDVEGFEQVALHGGLETIKKYKPTVVLELKSHGDHYGYTDLHTIGWIEALGYKLERVIRTDHIFVAL